MRHFGMRTALAGLWLVAVVGGGCGVGDLEPEPGVHGKRAGRVIYGADDRKEKYQGTAAEQGAAAAVYMVVRRSELTCSGGTCTLATVPFTDWFSPPLCSDEPYRTQPTIGHCTAFLVGPDLMATAGHCIGGKECGKISFLPRYWIDAAGGSAPVTIPESAVLRCGAKVVRKLKGTNDYAVWRTATSASGVKPLCIRRSGAPAVGTDVTIIGFPYNIPLKIAGGASVRGVLSNYFTVNTDDYAGNSGSPIFDAATMRVEGILVRGNPDFVVDSARNCTKSNRCPDSGCAGTFEEATHIRKIASVVPPVACYAPPSGCTTDADCDDGNPCTVDTCGAGVCVATPGNAGATCRAAAGACDVAEVCDGSAASCPADGFKAATVVCRAAAGECDATERCTGTSGACPADAYQPAGTTCTAGTCNGSGACTSGGDTVTIRKAEYRVSKKELKVEAVSTDATATLTVVGYGTMTYDARKNRWKFRKKPVSPAPSSVTVTSDRGGSATRAVTSK